jgi:hypothetical protein
MEGHRLPCGRYSLDQLGWADATWEPPSIAAVPSCLGIQGLVPLMSRLDGPYVTALTAISLLPSSKKSPRAHTVQSLCVNLQ